MITSTSVDVLVT